MAHVAKKKAKRKPVTIYSKILNSLENKDYKYRTLQGIAKERCLRVYSYEDSVY